MQLPASLRPHGRPIFRGAKCHTTFYVPLWGFPVVICTTPEQEASMHEWFRVDPPGRKGAGYMTEYTSQDGSTVFLVVLKTLSTAILAHELSHVVDGVENAVGAKFCTETRAYLLDAMIQLAGADAPYGTTK